MKQLFFLLLLACSCSLAHAQKGDRFERIHAAKVAFITDRIHLTSAQASQFWPVYDQYEEEVHAIRQQIRQNLHSTGSDAMEKIDNNIEYQQKILDLKKKYKDQMLKVISAQQLAQLYNAEPEWRKLLVDQLRQNGGR